MYSSDSDDDIYGNIIKKRDELLSYYEANHKEGITLDDSVVSNEVEEKNNTKTKSGVSRGDKTKRRGASTSIPSKRGRKTGKLSKTECITSASKDVSNSEDSSVNAIVDLTECDYWVNTNNVRRTSTRLQTAKSLQNESNSDGIVLDIDYDSSDTNNQNKGGNKPSKKSTRGASTSTASTRGRKSRGRSSSRSSTNSRVNSSSRGNSKSRGSSKSRGRGRGKGRSKAKTTRGRNTTTRSRTSQRTTQQDSTCNIPTYSIGNTEEYDDELENVQMFSSLPKKNIASNDLDDKSFENEELSVKVCWQSINIHKFSIRRFQKIKEIYDFFMKKENVPITNLILMYNDIILSPDDSPDSIDYKITSFIEGGIINNTKNFKPLKVIKKFGVEIKFQCEKVKRPLVVYMEKDEKFSIPMIKCAEQLEIPLKKLKFEFDGDIITGSETLQSLDMEGGECIDVKIID